ncbi:MULTISPECIES: methylenetetrahydrofolate--tRNA-(uracil(54)-C(5))-methyltransferase (FADH(2)-oxidizing) TrmFO [Slackia]|uniref:methylenetetrahydrofolate--tRNA-(uracil(54)- C(5))-methyltransferase (FADH(2)-oxidizing) TrmFO n=1 Tax=Slackia TaxID=84108 RepID=UPI00257DF677|nr:methylenetetrahydrofolate--tRNA-(uracil(54)-C(5))-methyltransferase (FADH(2)-oxidizing) TrmFO [Slackia sp.]MBS6498723.1 methylenetetrahydrofolate--tRNA-(uracil(54)-C(5))-methyltransferase (FADH(2)-oxidizing) TrmFO [Slackia sp.]
MDKFVNIIGAGLAGSEAALQLAQRGVHVRLFEMRPETETDVHRGGDCAELVCSNSLKSTKPESAAGMLKAELAALGSQLIAAAGRSRVDAGGALAVDRDEFSADVTSMVKENPYIEYRVMCVSDPLDACLGAADATILATGPLTSDALAQWLVDKTGSDNLAFFDAAAPVVMADSLDMDVLFRQSRYEQDAPGDYLNAPFDKESYDAFIAQLVAADRVIKRDFETKDLFQACQPIEEIARKGADAPRFGTCKPVGLTDPATGRRPWAAVQLRAENAQGTAYNLVGFQTNLTFGEQKRVFRMIPGLQNAEFARYGVMHRNTFIQAPRLLDRDLRLRGVDAPVYVAGQLSGTEGYCEAIASGLMCALFVYAQLQGMQAPLLPVETAFGALLDYATDPATQDYQPMHVNFGILKPLDQHIRNKGMRYAAYAERGSRAMEGYVADIRAKGLL